MADQGEEQKVATEDLTDATRDLADFAERVIYAALAFVVTSGTMTLFFHFEFRETVEASMLNAGIAYYTHAASWRVIRALFVIARPHAEKCVEVIKREPKVRGEEVNSGGN